MRMRENAFMITCPSRSGSTFLVHLLRSHPDILCHGEVLVGDRLTGIYGSYRTKSLKNPEILEQLAEERRENFERFFYQRVLDSQDKKLVGFKLKSDELVLPEYEVVKDVVARDRDIAVIHLNRRNFLERYLSWYVADQVTGIHMVHQTQELPDVPPVHLDPQACLADFKAAQERETFTRTLFKDHPMIEVCYEDLVAAHENVSHHIFDFLRPPRRFRTSLSHEKVFHDICDFLGASRRFLTSVTKKIIQRPPHEAISNYTELKSFFQGTPYIEFFTE